jgi:SAM-dependent methyltransferase
MSDKNSRPIVAKAASNRRRVEIRDLGRPASAKLLNAASRPYLKAGPGLFAYFFARGKLSGDPVYRALLERGLLAGRSRILDLGCGQGLLFAWLRAAALIHDLGIWPHTWPPPPRPTSIRGIELKARDVKRAHRALGPDVGIETGDIRHAEFGAVDAVVILDVLHYLPPPAQCDVVRRVRAALPAGGLLLLRVGDAASGLRSRYSQWVDTVVMLLRGHAWARQHCRSVGEWQSILREAGFASEALPMSQGTPFANVLLIAFATQESVESD